MASGFGIARLRWVSAAHAAGIRQCSRPAYRVVCGRRLQNGLASAHDVADLLEHAHVGDRVAATIVEAALGAWKMRHTPKGEATLLRRLRRFMPAGPVDSGLRKTFGLG